MSDNKEKNMQGFKGVYMPVWMLLLVIIVGIGIPGFIIYGNILQSMTKSRCSVETQAYVSDVYFDKYLKSPYYGGRVYEACNTYVTYTFEADGVSHDFKMISTYERIDYPETITVKYNPEDSSEYFYNINEYDDTITEDYWWYSRHK